MPSSGRRGSDCLLVNFNINLFAGCSNIAGAFVSSYPVTGSFSR